MKQCFTCTNCDAQFSKWTGRCLECGKWGTVVEQEQIVEEPSRTQKKKTHAPATIVSISEMKINTVPRITTTLYECDRVFGGGIVSGSLTLLGGEPGIGKSTLALQIATQVKNCIYFSAEESGEQILLRAKRLKTNSTTLALCSESDVDTICATLEKKKPSLAIIDSIQTIYTDDISGEPGNMNQIRACTVKLLDVAKKNKISIIIIGHVTKEGTVAGPRTLEHLVDTVLYLEGERHHSYRILRTVKNRFGTTDEVGIFEMTETGLHDVKNASGALLEERTKNVSGSVITCLMEGTRPLLIEIQALVNKTSFGYPVRKASGFDLNRLHVLVAVLEKRSKLNLGQYDIHINVVGGMTANEPAADLAVCLAIASSFKDKPVGQDLVVFGEVGLGGEIRSVPYTKKRLKEAEHLGMKRAILSASKIPKNTTLKTITVSEIQSLIAKT